LAIKGSGGRFFVPQVEDVNRSIFKLTLTTLLIINLLISCSNSWQSVFEGSPKEVEKIRNLLVEAGVSNRIQESAGKLAIYIPTKDYKRVSTSLRQLRAILVVACRTENVFQEYFLPVSGVKVTQGTVFSKFLASIEARSEVFSVSCADRLESDGMPRQKITVWYASSGEMDLAQLESNVYNNAEALGLDLRDQVDFKEIPWSVGGKDEVLDSKPGMIVFEPFSFRVLESEKSVAGIQFLVMLVLFLISGFTLGYWWGKR